MTGFPKNPDDGEVYQVNDQVVYQFNKSKNCWIKLSGPNVGLATIQEPGLMSKDDFIKINEILLPVFDTTITGEYCDDLKFEEGRVDITSSNDDIKVEAALKMYNPNGVVQEKDFVIHNNTIGIDFRINMPRLIEELNLRNALTYKTRIGDQGDKGDRGKPGINNLDTGPIGDKGPDGISASFPGTIDEDLNQALPTNRAIVDVRNDEDNPRKIIVVIGNIGKPGVGPTTVSWKNKNSQWIMGLSGAFNCNVPQECAPSHIVYVDIGPILDKIEDKFSGVLENIRSEKEKISEGFIKSLSNVFSAQRQAVCCALESTLSRKVNQKIRNIMSNGRYQAAQAHYAFKVESNSNNQYERVPSQDRPNPYGFLPGAQDQDPSSKVIVNGDLSQNPVQFDCDDCFVQLTIDKTNLGSNRSVSVDLPSGLYVATIIDCCMFYEGLGGSGVFTVAYNDKPDDEEIDDKPESCGIIKVRSKGFFKAIEDRNEYIGESVSFRHHGGVVEFFGEINPASEVKNGITLCIQPSHCFQRGVLPDLNPVVCNPDYFIFGKYPGKTVAHELGDTPESSVIVGYDFYTSVSRIDIYHPAILDPDNLVATSGNVIGSGFLNFIYEDIEDKGNQILVDIVCKDKNAEFNYVVACESQASINVINTSIIASHARWYQNGFIKRSSCAAHVNVGDTDYLVVFKSIGADCTCGGGEYEKTKFISDVRNRILLQPALAWPTLDGITFFGLPENPNEVINLTFDKSLSDIIISKIRNDDVISKVGDPSVISAIVFPET